MMRQNRTKQTHWPKRLTVSALAFLLAASLGASGAYADESVPAAAQGQTVQSQTTEVQGAKVDGKSTALLPGDFFYFIKTIYEQIRLALTSNDLKEAQLLAEFAQTRLSEANALLAKGKVAEATQSIQKSLEVQQSAVEKAEKIPVVASGTSAASSTSAPEQSSVQTAGQKATEAAAQENPASQAGQKDQVQVKDKEKVIKVKNDLQHNITALAAALEKIENPKAQLALMKNIEKSFAHLEEKLQKIERKKGTEPVQQSANSAASQVTAAAEASSVVPENAAIAVIAEATVPNEANAVQAEGKQGQKEKSEKAEKPAKPEKPEKSDKLEKQENREKEDPSDKREQPAKEQKNDGHNGKGNEKPKDNRGNGNHNEQGRR